MGENKLDGNAAGGILQEIFPLEMTSVLTTCARCGATKVVAELAVYIHGMGMVVRCPSCDNVLIHVARIKGYYSLDTQGVYMQPIDTAI
ncbi:MAG TPA: DUF6510 family protein [Ktedonobacteraceae bacterium]|jgi:hypothetical protein|nr:DUF6510 family protein [Ktedonobacteraceae bacterium]